jgi:DNA-binding MarR family transcriptional regulator
VADRPGDLKPRGSGPRAERLTAGEFAIYSILGSSDRVTPTLLAKWMAAPLTSVSNYVKRFESRGHVERGGERRGSTVVPDPADGGRRRADLTERVFRPAVQTVANR